MTTENYSEELKRKITAHIEQLAQETDSARMSEAMLDYLDFCARFHRYSAFNIWLILSSCPTATLVAGYRKWQGMGRQVRQGESAIRILAPMLVKVEDEDGEEKQKLVGFKAVSVFDVSQTDGEPLPEAPDWKSPEQDTVLQNRLVAFAEAQGITVEMQELAGEVQGYSAGGRIVLSPAAGTKTLIHEIAHELMHQKEDRPTDKTILELEAESVAYAVARYFGLEGLASPNYVALHGADAKLILAHLERIRKTAGEIIRAIEKESPPVESTPENAVF